MISGHVFKKINNEKVLILYFDYSSEFGIDFKLRHKNNNMKKQITNYIKKHKIKLNNTKIVLSIGGIILAVLLVSDVPSNSEDMILTYVSDNIISNEIIEVIPPTDSSEEIEEDYVDNAEDDNIIVDDKQEVSNNNTSVNTNISKPETKPSTNNSNSSQTNNNQNSNSSNNTTTDSNKKEEVETPVVTEKQVTIYRSNGSVITLSLEEYLIGVVGAEMPASFSIEALKAQAIISRTYALKKIESGGKLTDNVSTQSYKDNDELKALWGSSFDTYYQKVKSAVLATKGLSIYYKGDLIDAVYHSTSNGKTQDSVHVWGNSIPYLKSVDSSWDKNATSYLREVSNDFLNVLNLLGIDANDDISFEILSRDNSGRVLEVRVGNKTFSGVEFRTLLGLRSADFDLTLEDNNLIITTRGYGHGVGMSQYGANGMAKDGYNYKQILKHYYTGVEIY